MQVEPTTLDPQAPTLRLGTAAWRMIAPGLVLAALGMAVAFLCAFRLGGARRMLRCCSIMPTWWPSSSI